MYQPYPTFAAFGQQLGRPLGSVGPRLPTVPLTVDQKFVQVQRAIGNRVGARIIQVLMNQFNVLAKTEADAFGAQVQHLPVARIQLWMAPNSDVGFIPIGIFESPAGGEPVQLLIPALASVGGAIGVEGAAHPFRFFAPGVVSPQAQLPPPPALGTPAF